ncbi:hypothetical protein OHB53_09530 [Streptomyces sp. NBC_00056]|uniref:hypothetical protein n=1 Tax=Streptomyces sp. NBC_00056 TaxID=2975633 RepID=UPI003247BE3C
MIIHDLADAALTVLYGALAWSVIAGAIITSAVIALAGAITGMWTRIGRHKRAPAEYKEAA